MPASDAPAPRSAAKNKTAKAFLPLSAFIIAHGINFVYDFYTFKGRAGAPFEVKIALQIESGVL